MDTAFVTVTVTTTYEGESMDTDFAIYRAGEFWRVSLADDAGDESMYFDELDTYPEALQFALEAHGSTV